MSRETQTDEVSASGSHEIHLGLANLERHACTDYEAEDLPKLAARIKATSSERPVKKRSVGG